MEHRREKRFASYAKVVLVDTNNLGYLRDLNSLGCQVDFVEPPPVKIGDKVEICIIPNEEMGIPNVELTVEIKWMRQEQPFISLGGALDHLPDEQGQHYESLLSYFRE